MTIGAIWSGRHRFRWLALAGFAFAVLYAIRVARWRPYDVNGALPQDGLFRAAGVVHVHTTFSDGGAAPEEVIRAARSEGLRFLVITDHNNLKAKPLEGYHDGLLVLVGVEISTEAGHLLGLGLERDPVFRFSQDARDGLDDIRHLGGFAFAAHPLSPREDLAWTGWELPGAWGLELINGDSEWRRAGARALLTAGLYSLNHRYALLKSLGHPDLALSRWDALLAQRNTPGLAGTDAHGRLPVTEDFILRFPSYESLFSVVRNHVLLHEPLQGEVGRDRSLIVDALRAGRSYIGLDALAPAGGFSFTAESRGRRWTMGESVPISPELVLRAGGRVPRGAKIRLLRDGRVEQEAAERIEVKVQQPGVYRIEVRLPGWDVPWILTNPIYMFDEATQTKRAARAAWPEPPEPPVSAQLIDRFEGTTTLQPGHDPTSNVAADILDPAAGPDGSGAARLSFRMGDPTRPHPSPYCALVSWEHRDLSGHRGLVLAIKADGEYRVWVQVRDENPASQTEDTEWWFTSVRTSTEWQKVSLPFSAFRTVNPKTDRRLDLDRVRALVFVLDRGSVKVGTEGTIWIDDLGVY